MPHQAVLITVEIGVIGQGRKSVATAGWGGRGLAQLLEPQAGLGCLVMFPWELMPTGTLEEAFPGLSRSPTQKASGIFCMQRPTKRRQRARREPPTLDLHQGYGGDRDYLSGTDTLSLLCPGPVIGMGN